MSLTKKQIRDLAHTADLAANNQAIAASNINSWFKQLPDGAPQSLIDEAKALMLTARRQTEEVWIALRDAGAVETK